MNEQVLRISVYVAVCHVQEFLECSALNAHRIRTQPRARKSKFLVENLNAFLIS